MPFCAPIWRLFFKRDQDATTTEKNTSRERLDKGTATATAENKSRPNLESKARVLTKEEKLKEQRKKDIAQLRETLRLRRELLDGIVEVPLKKGTTIEGYQIRVIRGPSQGVLRSPCNAPTTKSTQPQHTKESMEKFSRFIESKIKQGEEETKTKDKGKACERTTPKDPVQDALIKRLLELQAERYVKKKGQSERTDKRTKPIDESKSGKDRSRKCSNETSKAQKDVHKEQSNKTKEILNPNDQSPAKHKTEKHEPEHERADDKKMKFHDDDKAGKGITIDSPKKSSKENEQTEKTTRDGSPKIKGSKGGKSIEKRDTTDTASEHHDKTSKFEEGEHNRETPDEMKHSKAEEDGEEHHEGTEKTHGEEHDEDDVGDGGEPHVGEHKKSVKSKKSKDKK